jgi:hypothetical protein
VLIFLSVLSTSLACDTSLISLLSGEDPTDSFVVNVASLSMTIKSLGEEALKVEKALPLLDRLMMEWVEFDVAYSNSPPVWAKKDNTWKSKFKLISNGIGMIRQGYQQKDLELAHRVTLSISRKISRLFEFMPMDETNRYLVNFAMYIDKLWDAFYADDGEAFGASIADFESSALSFNSQLSKGKKLLAQDFLIRINEVKLFSTPRPPSMSNMLSNNLELIEKSFVNLNLAFSSQAEIYKKNDK